MPNRCSFLPLWVITSKPVGWIVGLPGLLIRFSIMTQQPCRGGTRCSEWNAAKNDEDLCCSSPLKAQYDTKHAVYSAILVTIGAATHKSEPTLRKIHPRIKQSQGTWQELFTVHNKNDCFPLITGNIDSAVSINKKRLPKSIFGKGFSLFHLVHR